MTGHQPQKLSCPHCGKRKCFVRYVDTKNNFSYVADTVGKCDHQHSCGYHYKPSEYYRDNQWARERDVIPSQHAAPKPLPPFIPLDMAYVRFSHSSQSTFWYWFITNLAQRLKLSVVDVWRVYNEYMLGATRHGHVIFWQIDHHGLVHGGHIMQYHADGHRGGYQGWTHIPLIRAGWLPPEWTLYQCLFGQHLLARYPDRHVCLVESEKTALIMAAVHPEHIWLATCGCGGLSPERLNCLRGRRVTLFPDSGCYQKWSRQMQLTTGILYNISPRLECYQPNTDLADLVLGDAHPP